MEGKLVLSLRTLEFIEFLELSWIYADE